MLLLGLSIFIHWSIIFFWFEALLWPLANQPAVRYILTCWRPSDWKNIVINRGEVGRLAKSASSPLYSSCPSGCYWNNQFRKSLVRIVLSQKHCIFFLSPVHLLIWFAFVVHWLSYHTEFLKRNKTKNRGNKQTNTTTSTTNKKNLAEDKLFCITQTCT